MSAAAAAGGAFVAASVAYWAAFGSRSQLFGAFPYEGDTDRKVVALTFDDGPNEPYTSRLLDTLQDREVPATFFQVGRCAQRFPAVTRRVVDSGHVLGNHSLSHSFGRYLSEPRQRREIEQGEQALAEVSGVRPALYRPPWLCHWPWVLRSVQSAGLQVVSGTFGHSLEVFQPPARWLTAGAASRVGPGTVLILHDGREARGGDRAQTVASVGPLVDLLRQRGYGFTTVDRLLGVPAYR
ncbi:MAG TPA: polysaccharide deacetylase family protein [Propionibacteriaceae bacterium]|nr:polysaccharide deacetylase family protein [Propionibacteriaceae bacterium]